MKSFFIVVNEHANSGKSKQNWQLVKSTLDNRQINYTFKITNHDAKQVAYSFAKNLTTASLDDYIVMVVGGDGTLNDTINGLKHAHLSKDLPLSFIPSGNTKSFAKGSGISNNPAEALNQILIAKDAQYLDIGCFEEITHNKKGYFLNDFGIGIDAYIVSLNTHIAHHTLFKKMHLGFLPYIWNVLKAYFNQESFNVTVRVDNKYEFYKHAFLVNIANHPYFNKHITLSPEADVNDHKLDLIIADNINFFNCILFSIFLYFKKQLKLPSVYHYKKKEIHLIINSLEFGQIDGEEQGNKYYDICFKVSKYPFWFSTTE